MAQSGPGDNKSSLSFSKQDREKDKTQALVLMLDALGDRRVFRFWVDFFPWPYRDRVGRLSVADARATA
jgi:predicted DCC family thiol-disulfide oxidoreductase YuxK